MESAVLFMLIIFLAFFLFMWIRQLIIPEKEKKINPSDKVTIIMPKEYKYTCITEENKCMITIEF